MKSWICTTLSNFWAPMQGAARLFAYQKQEGHDISLKDFNQDAYFSLLGPQFLAETALRLSYHAETVKRTASLRDNLGSILLNSSGGYLPRLLDPEGRRNLEPENLYYTVIGEAPALLAKIQAAVALVDERFLDLPEETFLKSYRTMCCGKALIDALYFPAQLDFGFGLHGIAVSASVDSICRFRDNVDTNFLIPYFEREVVPMFEAEAPRVVGISISHASDIAPVLTLARILKRHRKDVHICLGGSVLTELAYKFSKNPQLWDDVDSAVLGPGEESFSALLECVESGGDLGTVPNVIYKQGDRIVQSGHKKELDLNRVCTPDYGSLRPKPVIALESAAGCYWGKCVFCYYPQIGVSDIHAKNLEPSRPRDIERVLKDMHTLTERHRPSLIAITDSALSPQRLRDIAEDNRARGVPVHFGGFMRFEKAFRSVDFCRELAKGGFVGGQAGLESGSQRVNNFIHKGVDLEDVRVILKSMADAGLLLHLYSMVGIPGETAEEATETYRFILEHRELLTLDWQIYSFYAMENGPIAARAQSLGLTLTPYPSNVLVQIADYTVQSGCTQQESLMLSIQFEELLRPHRNPLHRIMDIESYKVFLLAQKALSTDV